MSNILENLAFQIVQMFDHSVMIYQISFIGDLISPCATVSSTTVDNIRCLAFLSLTRAQWIESVEIMHEPNFALSGRALSNNAETVGTYLASEVSECSLSNKTITIAMSENRELKLSSLCDLR